MLFKAEAEAEVTVGADKAAKAKKQGYEQGHADALEYLRKVLVMLAQTFQEDAHFKAYLHYVDERQQVEAEGQDLEEVEFIPPFGEGEGPGDEATNPLDAEARTPEDEGREDSKGPNI